MRRLAAVIIKYTNLPIIVIPRKLAQIHQKRKRILKTDSQSYFGRFDDFHIPDRQQAQPGEKVTADLIHFTPRHNLRKARADSGRAYQSHFRRASNRRRMEEIRAVVRTILSTYLSRGSFGQREREREERLRFNSRDRSRYPVGHDDLSRKKPRCQHPCRVRGKKY